MNRREMLSDDRLQCVVGAIQYWLDISIAGKSNEQSAGFNTKDDSLSDTNDTLISLRRFLSSRLHDVMLERVLK